MIFNRRDALLTLLLALTPVTAADWVEEVFAAPNAAARLAAFETHRDKATYPAVRGFARAALTVTDQAYAEKVLLVAAEMAEFVDDSRARAYAAMYLGYFRAGRGEWSEALAAFDQAVAHWHLADRNTAVQLCNAWAGAAAAHLIRLPDAEARLRASLTPGTELAAALAAQQPVTAALLTGWASYLSGLFEEDYQRWPAAEGWYRAAIEALAETGPALLLGHAANRAGLVCYYQSKLADASAFYQTNLRLGEELGHAFLLGRARLGFGEVALDRGQLDEADEQLRLALPHFEAARDLINLARCHAMLATALQLRGRHSEVDSVLSVAERYYREAESPGGVGHVLFVRGTNWLLMGDRARALAAFQESHDIAERANDYLGQANAKLKMAQACRVVGLSDRSERLAQDALDLYRMVHDKPGEGNALRALGLVEIERGNLAEAEDFLRQALAIYEAIDDPFGRAAALYRIGKVMQLRGDDLEPTIGILLEAMHLSEQLGDQHGASLPCLALGQICLANGEGELARKAFLKSLDLGERSSSPMTIASALHNLGLLCEAADPPKLDAAAGFHQSAVELAEQMREAAGDTEAQQGLQATYHPYYEALVRVLLRLDRAVEAFDYSERSHGRTLLDMVLSARMDASVGMALGEKALERAKEARLTRATVALGRALAADQAPEAELDRLRDEVAEARLDLREFQERLYLTRPDLKRRRAAALASAEEVIAGLPAGTAMVQYLVGWKATYVFVLQPGAPEQVRTAVVEVSESDLAAACEQFRAICANPRRRYAAVARDLHAQLIQPALALLEPGTTRLVLVPDGPLHELPFQALADDDGFLWERYEIGYAASGSLLLQTLQAEPVTTTGLLAFANPDFGNLVRSAALQRGQALANLPGTEVEAKAISEQFGNKATVYLGKEAREQVAKQQLGRYRYVHFATHGILDSASPMYSSVILAEPTAGDEEDGQLEARELMDIPLQADLVTLSACETGRGKVRPGEGLLGLTWALSAAGARSVVVSQWKVNDETTAALMTTFYTQLQAGAGKAQALREAAAALRAEHRHPYYWAPFILVGQW